MDYSGVNFNNTTDIIHFIKNFLVLQYFINIVFVYNTI